MYIFNSHLRPYSFIVLGGPKREIGFTNTPVKKPAVQKDHKNAGTAKPRP